MASSSVVLICIDKVKAIVYILPHSVTVWYLFATLIVTPAKLESVEIFRNLDTALQSSLFGVRSITTIASDLKHIDHQLTMTPSLQKAIDFLRLRGIHDLPDGRVEIDGQKVYAIVQRYETTDTGRPKFEYHKKYIDIQFIASGKEVIGWAPVESIAITEAYDADKDVAFGTAETGKWTPLALQAGQLAVLYPEDGHAPRLAFGEGAAVMKIVVKVEV